MGPDPDKRNLLEKKATKRIQSIMGAMIYYAQSVDSTMIREINEISRVKSQPTWDTEEKSRMLLDDATTYPNEIPSYKASDMVLHVDSDASYLTMPETRSCYAGHFYLGNWPSPSPIKPNHDRNGPIHMECKKIHNVVSYAAETETCGTLKNRKTDIDIKPTIIKLDH